MDDGRRSELAEFQRVAASGFWNAEIKIDLTAHLQYLIYYFMKAVTDIFKEFLYQH